MECFSAILLFDAFSARKRNRVVHWITVTAVAFLDATLLNFAATTILVGVIEILRQNDVYLITTECDLNAELINSGLERFVGDRFTRASFGKPRFDVRLPLMDQF